MSTLSDLNNDQKRHLAWRLDSKTACGRITACSVVRGEQGNLDLITIFKKFGNCSPRSAAAHARLTEKFIADPTARKVSTLCFEIQMQIFKMVKEANLTGAESKKLYQHLIVGIKNTLRLYKDVDWESLNKKEARDA